jgi:hypothetical protein
VPAPETTLEEDLFSLGFEKIAEPVVSVPEPSSEPVLVKWKGQPITALTDTHLKHIVAGLERGTWVDGRAVPPVPERVYKALLNEHGRRQKSRKRPTALDVLKTFDPVPSPAVDDAFPQMPW